MRWIRLLALTIAACGGGAKTAPAPAGPAPVAEAPAPPPAPPPPTEREQRVADRVLECLRAVNARDAAAIAGCHTDTAEASVSGSSEKTVGGKDIAEKFYQPISAGFPDVQFRVPLLLVNGSRAAALAHGYGLHGGTWMGHKRTNRPVGVYLARFIELEDEKIARELHVFDPATVLAQIGKLKTPARKMTEPPAGETRVVLAQDDARERANADVVRSVCAALSRKDAAALLALLHDDVVWSDQTSPTDLEGKAAVEAELKAIFVAFPDIQVSCDPWGAGDHVANLATWTATNKGAWKDVGISRATNKTVNVQDGEIYELADGKVKRYWRFSNGLAMAGQLGLVPAPRKKAK
jgi:steroid delta-isomerase-like uncharacterized protein